MGKLESVRGELIEYFASKFGDVTAFGPIIDISAQGYEGGPRAFDPALDMRLVNAMKRRRSRSWREVRGALDDLSEADVEVLRLACRGAHHVAARLPRALELGRQRAEELARMNVLKGELSMARLRSPGLGVTVAMRVLEAEAALPRRMPITRRDIDEATLDGCREGLIDVTAEAEAIIDAVVDRYLAARNRGRSAKRVKESKRRSDYAASLKADRDARAAKSIERRCPGVLDAVSTAMRERGAA